MAKTLSIEKWRAANMPKDAVLKMDGFDLQVVRLLDQPQDARNGGRIEFIISTGSEDRMRDRVIPEGGKIGQFLKNPVVLYAHDSSGLPIARAESIDLVDGAWKSIAVFPSEDLHPFANQVYRLLVSGYLRAASIGFRPLKVQEVPERNGFDFVEWELMEWSVCPVGANQDALAIARRSFVGDDSEFDLAVKALADATPTEDVDENDTEPSQALAEGDAAASAVTPPTEGAATCEVEAQPTESVDKVGGISSPTGAATLQSVSVAILAMTEAAVTLREVTQALVDGFEEMKNAIGVGGPAAERIEETDEGGDPSSETKDADQGVVHLADGADASTVRRALFDMFGVQRAGAGDDTRGEE